MVSNNEHSEEAGMKREDDGVAGLGMHPLPEARLEVCAASISSG